MLYAQPARTLKDILMQVPRLFSWFLCLLFLLVGPGVYAQGEAIAGEETSLGLMLLFAYVGGLILNIMPCVLPVLSIKALGLVQQAEEGRKTIMMHGIAYALGVLVSFGVMAGLVIALQASGKLVGWGFQLQSPIFVAILGGLTFGFGLSLFGVYEIAMPGASTLGAIEAKKHGTSGSFVSGVFAVILATPCTAPFMAPALGFAMSQPPTVLLLFLEVIGLGLATPFLLLGFFPAWVRLVPKPGAWMETFKKVMGFLLVGTTVWLIDILSHQVTTSSLIDYLIFLTILSLAAWVYGHWGGLLQEQRTRIGAFVVSIALIAGGGNTFLSLEKRTRTQAVAKVETASPSKDIVWKDFATNDVLAMAKAGKTVFIDFTAEWCVTCKAFEKTVINTDKIKAAFAENCVETVKADYTNEDEEITKWLKKYKRPGVPMYLIVPAGKPDGVITLPDLLTQESILEGLKKSGPSEKCTPEQSAAKPEKKGNEIVWKDFATNDVLAMAKAGKTVFIDFTAEWCVTCKAFEKTVINTEEIRQAFADKCVETVKADYTNEDEEITKWLKKYKRPGVPMYLIVPAGKPDGVITLPDLLTQSSILEGLKRSGASDGCS